MHERASDANEEVTQAAAKEGEREENVSAAAVDRTKCRKSK